MMGTVLESKKRVRVLGLLCLGIFSAELFLCFTGPIAFNKKPTLMLFPPFATGLNGAEYEEVSDFIERELALTNSFSIVSNRFIQEYFIRTDPDGSRAKIAVQNESEAQRIAAELGFERYAVATVSKSERSFWMFVFVHTTRDGKEIRHASLTAPTIQEALKTALAADRDKENGTPDVDPGSLFDKRSIREQITVETRGIGFTDILILGLLSILLMVSIVAITGQNPGLLIDVLLSLGIILFLFAFIHAGSANMDYVQRYIANGGALKQAHSTAEARLHAFLRYGPILLVGFAFYINKGMKQVYRKQLHPTYLDRYIKPWALCWTILSAFLFAVSFPSFLRLNGLSPLAWVSLVPLFLVLLSSNPAPSVLYGVVFGTIQALIVNYWHGTYNYVTLHMITIAFAAEFILFMVPLVLVIRLSGKWGFLTVPAAWTLFDFFRSSGIIGYPWALAGTSQYNFLPLIQIASVTGVWGIGFVVLLVNTGIAWSFSGEARGWRWPALPVRLLLRFRKLRTDCIRAYYFRKRLSLAFPATAAVSVFLFSLIAGVFMLNHARIRLENADKTGTVVLVQQNTDPRKHEIRENTDKLMELTDRAVAELSTRGESPDLIAWPEGGFRLDLRYWTERRSYSSYWSKMTDDFLTYQRDLGIWLMTGTQDHRVNVYRNGSTKKENFNSSVLLNPDGGIDAYYHKIRLVPFSEHFPLDKEKYSGLYEMFQEYDISNWTMGDERKIFQTGALRVATPICFEDVFPDHVRRFVQKDTDVILNMSNDYWSLSPVEGRQHGVFALFRAVENRRPLLRSTCSGYTVAISPTGEILPGAPEPYTEGYVTARVPLPEQGYTLYTRFGDWFPKACGLFAVLFAAAYSVAGLIRRLRRRRRKIYVPFGDMSIDELSGTGELNPGGRTAARF